MAIIRVRPGVQTAADNTYPELRGTKKGSVGTQDLGGRFEEACARAALFTGGMALTAINNATYTSATTGATATPIAGVWNPSTNTVNLVILQAYLGLTITALAATGPGPFVWMASVGNTAISTGAAPWNTRTLTQTGSSAKNLANAALTGLTNVLATVRGSSLFGGSASNASFTATAVAMQTQQQSAVENIDGSFIVPPGGILALMATTTPAAHSGVSGLLWEEVPVGAGN